MMPEAPGPKQLALIRPYQKRIAAQDIEIARLRDTLATAQQEVEDLRECGAGQNERDFIASIDILRRDNTILRTTLIETLNALKPLIAAAEEIGEIAKDDDLHRAREILRQHQKEDKG